MNQPSSLKAAVDCLKSSVDLLAAGKNEQIVRDSFTSYLRLIFPSVPSWVERHIKSSEAAVTILSGARRSTGFVDNLVDLTVIEYESDLTSKHKFEEGYEQLKDYCAALINVGHRADLVLGILSDTVRWFVYSVRVKDSEIGKLTRVNIELIEIDKEDLSKADENSGRRLIAFLLKYLGRIGARPLNAESIAGDLGFNSPFCSGHITEFQELTKQAFADRPKYAKLIASLWSNFVSYFRDQGTAAEFNPRAYTDELYILTLGKLICANVIERKALISDDANLRLILNGNYFVAKGLANLVEYDYFGWLNESPYIEKQLLTARGIQNDLQAYDFSQAPTEDLFGDIMAQIAERSKRLLLGQELTPEWLASRTVAKVFELLPRQQLPQLVDMCCGSGAMIVQTVKRAKPLITANPALKNDERLHFLTQAITGFDIDPLAVILSKINWVLAARDWLEPFGAANIVIPVYHADSLFAITPLTEGVDEESKDNFYALKIAEYTVKLPKFILTPEFQSLFDGLLDRTYSIVRAVKPPNKLNLTDHIILEAIDSVCLATSTKLTVEQKKSVVEFVHAFTEKVDQLNREGRNGIWTFILRNSYRPGLVAGQFNGLVSNVPWLALSKLANNPYRALLKKKAELFGITPPGSSHLHIELATIFLLHSVDRYLRSDAIVGCIAPETLLNGYHHNPFRLGTFEKMLGLSLEMDSIWRVQEGTFKNNAIVLFCRKKTKGASHPDPIPGGLATEHGITALSFNRHAQGSRVIWNDQTRSDGAEMVGFFCPANFRQGADIMPRTFFLYEPKKLVSGGQIQWTIQSIDKASSRLAFAIKDAKKCADFRITPCVVPDEIMFDVLTSNLLTPFHLAPALKALLPLTKNIANEIEFLNDVAIAAKGKPIQHLFEEICAALGSRATIADLANLLNVRNKLTQQVLLPDKYLVFTGAGGGRVCSAFLAPDAFDAKKIIIDQTLYWAQVESEDEALYLTGLLNSDAINLIIKDFQPKGAFGERHVHKLPFGVTPPYDASQAIHQDVVETTKQLIAEYRDEFLLDPKALSALNPNEGSLAHRRLAIHAKLKTLKSYLNFDNVCKALYGV